MGRACFARLVATGVLAAFGCQPGSFQGACVWTTFNDESGCSEVDPAHCQPNGGSPKDAEFHLGSSCEELGFDEDCETEEGDSYACGSGLPGGGNPSCGEYAGPTGDVQVDGFCQAAWSASCVGNQQEVDANCATYDNFQKIGTTEPCPYC